MAYVIGTAHAQSEYKRGLVLFYAWLLFEHVPDSWVVKRAWMVNSFIRGKSEFNKILFSYYIIALELIIINDCEFLNEVLILKNDKGLDLKNLGIH